MTELKRFLPGEVKEIRVLGRTVMKETSPVLFWTGSGLEMNYEGAELWCEIETDYSCYEQWIAVLVNGALLTRQMLQKGKQRICLFRNMQTLKVNHIKVLKEVQAMPGDESAYLEICALYGDGTFTALPEPECRLEFIGDSITSGEGSCGSTIEQDWISMWFSATRTYPFFVTECLSGECRVVSQSGYGVYCAYDNNLDHTIPKHYEQVCGVLSGRRNEELGALAPYDFSSWQPDFVIINLGTNDGGAFHNPEWTDEQTGRRNKMYYGKDGLPAEECVQKVAEAVTEFLALVRNNNPDAHIIWAYGMMGTVTEPAILSGIEAYCTASGDSKVHYIRLKEIEGDRIGARSHPGICGHREAAEEICRKIAELKKKEEE